LSKIGETIAVFSPARTLVDSVSFGAQTSDVSQGRWPDGQSQTVSFPKATPGAPNANPSGVNQTRITGITAANGMVTIVFETEINQSYRVQYKDSLPGGDWTNLGDPVTATGASASVVDTLSATTQRYYRVLQLAAP